MEIETYDLVQWFIDVKPFLITTKIGIKRKFFDRSRSNGKWFVSVSVSVSVSMPIYPLTFMEPFDHTIAMLPM